MRMGGGVVHFCGFVAAVCGLATFAPHNPAFAEPAAPPAVFAPVPTPLVAEPHPFALPYSAPTYDLSQRDAGKFRKNVPEVSLDTVDLGRSLLRFEVVDVATRPIPDTPDLTEVIVPVRPGKKRSTPRYFGFTLTTPTH
jgi:hypothetical protein